MVTARPSCKGPGRFASALLLSAFGLLAPVPVGAQAPPPRPAQSLALPDQMSLAKLLWSTMAAIDHANKTGDYSVLRGLGAPSFQAANSEAALANVFAGVRNQRVDLSDTLMFEPVFEFPPAIQNGLLRMRGAFRIRPTGVQFDLLYEWSNGWRLQGVAIRALPMTQAGTRP